MRALKGQKDEDMRGRQDRTMYVVKKTLATSDLGPVRAQKNKYETTKHEARKGREKKEEKESACVSHSVSKSFLQAGG